MAKRTRTCVGKGRPVGGFSRDGPRCAHVRKEVENVRSVRPGDVRAQLRQYSSVKTYACIYWSGEGSWRYE